MQIELFADRPEFIPTLAEWHFREWAYFRSGDTAANRIRLLSCADLVGGSCPTFVASSGAELLGSAMLIHHEMDTRPKYTPWLAGVFVAPNERHRGIGRALTEHVVSEAAARGFPTVYLLTLNAETFFSDLGWSIVEHTRYRDSDVTIRSHRVA